ncbi:hypothetical protein [Streptomyces luteogriseus]
MPPRPEALEAGASAVVRFAGPGLAGGRAVTAAAPGTGGALAPE